MLKLIQHLVVKEDGTLPETSHCLYAYVLAGNGVFLKAKREGLDVLMPVASLNIVGLPTLLPYVHLSCSVPKNLLLTALELARQSFPNEILFWFNLGDCWSMDVPQQWTRLSGVMPLDSMDAKGTRALIDLHSHGALRPFFSATDNRDEQGFRIYAVLGDVNRKPTICARVGVYSHYFDIPASIVFEMPEEIIDANEDDWRQDENTVEQG
jgi:PRTRC genetic system protein A